MRSISSVSNIDPRNLSEESLEAHLSLVRDMQLQLNAVAERLLEEKMNRKRANLAYNWKANPSDYNLGA